MSYLVTGCHCYRLPITQHFSSLFRLFFCTKVRTHNFFPILQFGSSTLIWIFRQYWNVNDACCNMQWQKLTSYIHSIKSEKRQTYVPAAENIRFYMKLKFMFIFHLNWCCCCSRRCWLVLLHYFTSIYEFLLLIYSQFFRCFLSMFLFVRRRFVNDYFS